MAPIQPSAPPLDNLRRHMMMLLLTILMLLFLKSQSLVVDYLPGFRGKLPFKLHTGYIGVREMEEIQLFYYFIESESNPKEDPLVLWLTGGPGCSTLSGMMHEIGPFTVDYAKAYGSYGSIPSLIVNEYAWTKVANIIFLDQPVGTGFSYSETWEGYYSSDTSSASDTYEFLRKWLISNPKYLKNPLYIGGDSYSGIILPQVVDKVYNGIELGSEPLMNMKGYTLGNALTDRFIDFNGRIPYVHRMGLLSDKLYQSVKELCHENYMTVEADNVLCQKVLKEVNQCIEKIRQNQILEPSCDRSSKEDADVISFKDMPRNFRRSVATTTKSWCRDDNYVFASTWANDKSVQKALHVLEGKITKWLLCNETIQNSKTPQEGQAYVMNVRSTVDYHKKFTNKSCRALIYSGDHDILIPHTTTEEWIDSLKLQIQNDWRPWFVDEQVAGYAMTYGHGTYELTYATVKGGGHTAPEYKPIECLAMIRRWFNQSPL